VNESPDTRGAFRAAGQVVAAIAEGLPIESVSVKGVVLKPDQGPPHTSHGAARF
jgi:hypothetical protein